MAEITHAMVDLETLGNTSDAVVLSIGAVLFSVERGIFGDFYTTVDPQSCVAAGLTLSVSTIMWWMQQGDVARKAVRAPGVSLGAALADFAEFLAEHKEVRVWGNGATFDNVILANAYGKAEFKRPWSYKHDRCYRTLAAQHPDVQIEYIGTAHNALDDARNQAQRLLEIARIKNLYLY